MDVRRKGDDPNVSFHRFPHNNPEHLKIWIQAIRQQDWTPTKHSWICSKHFSESCFVVCPGKHGRRLYDHAVPSIFPNLPAHYQKPGTKWKSPKKRKYNSPKKRKYEEQPSCSSVESDHSYVQNVNVSEQLVTYKKEVKALKQKLH